MSFHRRAMLARNHQSVKTQFMVRKLIRMCRLLTLLFLPAMKANRSTLKFFVRYLTTYKHLPTKKNCTAAIKLICHCLKAVQLMFFRLCVDTSPGLRDILGPAKAPFRICYDCIIEKFYLEVITFLLVTRKPLRLSSHSYCPSLLTTRALMTVYFFVKLIGMTIRVYKDAQFVMNLGLSAKENRIESFIIIH